MKRYYAIFSLCIIGMTSPPTIAHQDFYTLYEIDNVKVRLLTGYMYEELDKVYIAGLLASNILKQLDYTGSVLLDFHHDYTNRGTSAYFASVGDGSIRDKQGKIYSGPLLKNEGIVIRQYDTKFGPAKTLILLEYAVTNLLDIKRQQDYVPYSLGHSQVLSIDPSELSKTAIKPFSPLVEKVLQTRVDKPESDEEKDDESISYYYQNGNYHVYINSYDTPEKRVLILKNIYHFERLSGSSVIVFDTNHSFHYVDSWRVSKRHTIENASTCYRPFKIHKIGGGKVSIYFWFYTNTEPPQKPLKVGESVTEERNLIYLIEQDKLIQDLDKALGIN